MEVLRDLFLHVLELTYKLSNPNVRYQTCPHTLPPVIKNSVILLCAKRPILSRFTCSFLNYDALIELICQEAHRRF
jgi:hypothetical protein